MGKRNTEGEEKNNETKIRKNEERASGTTRDSERERGTNGERSIRRTYSKCLLT